jgi:iron complex transport system substrate-binding protein
VPRIGDVVAIDMERLAALHPDVVVVWPGGGNPAQIEQITRMGIPVYRQQVNTFADMPKSLRRLGLLTGTSAAAEAAARDLEARVAQLARTYASDQRPTVLLEIWNRPIYTLGGSQLVSDALRICGTTNVFADLHDMAPAVDVEAVVARDPDIIVAVAPSGQATRWLSDWKRFTSMRAVRAGKLVAFDDIRLTDLGPSAVPATQELCKAIAATR